MRACYARQGNACLRPSEEWHAIILVCAVGCFTNSSDLLYQRLVMCRDPPGTLIKELLERNPNKPIFVVVKPAESSCARSTSGVLSETSSLGDSSTWEPSVVAGTLSGGLMSGMMTARESGVSRATSQDEDDDDSHTMVCSRTFWNKYRLIW